MPVWTLDIKGLFCAPKYCKYYPVMLLLLGQILVGNKLDNRVLAFYCLVGSWGKIEARKMNCSFFLSDEIYTPSFHSSAFREVAGI